MNINKDDFIKKYYSSSTSDGVIKIYVDDITDSTFNGYITLHGFLIYYSNNGITTDREWECTESQFLEDFKEMSYFEFRDELDDIESVKNSINDYLNKY